MAFQAAPRVVEVVFKGIQNGIPINNVFHVDTGGAVTPEILDDVLNVFVTWVDANWMALLHGSYTLPQIVATDISVEDGTQAEANFFPAKVGAGAGSPMAANAAMVASWRTALTGRSFRGRTYIGGLANGVLQDAQNVTATFAGDAAELLITLLDVLETAGFKLGILSRVANGVARAVAIITEVIGLVVDTKVDSQRRRTAN
jgi:hypothetical protein